jgi:hypothetical protein
MKNLNIRTHDNEVCISFLAACPNLQSLTVSLNQEFASQEIDRFIQNCSNLEIFKLTTDYKKLNSVKTNFQDLSTFSPKIQFLQWNKGFKNPGKMIQNNPSLIAIHSSSKLIVNSKSKFVDIDAIIAQFKATGLKKIEFI